MIDIVFRNLEASSLAREITSEKIQTTVDRFPGLEGHKLRVTLSMENSPIQAGPDLFKVKLRISGQRYKDIAIEKVATNLYAALADVSDHMLERLNRYGDKQRIKARNKERAYSVKQGRSYEENDL